MTESDGVAANTTFEQVFAKSTRSFNPSAGDMLKRENTRTFTVADNFQTLTQMRPEQCAAEPVGPNYQYPIVGTIGIDETIVSFLTMALHEDVNGALNAKDPPTEPSQSIAGAPTMVETLTFTTTLTAGATPAIMLTPVGTLTQLTGASLGLSLSRADVHAVTIGLGLPKVQAPQGVAGKFVPYSTMSMGHGSSARVRSPLLIDASVPAGTSLSSGQSVALEAVNNQIIRFQVLPGAVIAAP